jgi:hypothetical protein
VLNLLNSLVSDDDEREDLIVWFFGLLLLLLCVELVVVFDLLIGFLLLSEFELVRCCWMWLAEDGKIPFLTSFSFLRLLLILNPFRHSSSSRSPAPLTKLLLPLPFVTFSSNLTKSP